MCLKKPLSVFILMVLFVIMQIGMITHEVSHIHKVSSLGQFTANLQNSSETDKSATHEHCVQCLAHAQGYVALPSVASYILANLAVYFISTAYAAYLVAVIASVYQARAPPFLN